MCLIYFTSHLKLTLNAGIILNKIVQESAFTIKLLHKKALYTSTPLFSSKSMGSISCVSNIHGFHGPTLTTTLIICVEKRMIIKDFVNITKANRIIFPITTCSSFYLLYTLNLTMCVLDYVNNSTFAGVAELEVL